MAVAPVPTRATRLSASLSSIGCFLGAARVIVIPARGVEHVSLEVVNAGDAGQLGYVQQPIGHDHEAGANVVSLPCADPPALQPLVPAQRLHHGVEKRVFIEVVLLRDALGVFADFVTVGELLRRHEARFFEQRQIAVGVVVALQTGITVPVPHAAKVTRMINVAETGEAGIPDVNASCDAGPPAAEDGDIDFLADRCTGNDRRVGIRFIRIGEVVHRTDILLLPFLANAPVALLAVSFLQCRDIDLVYRG